MSRVICYLVSDAKYCRMLRASLATLRRFSDIPARVFWVGTEARPVDAESVSVPQTPEALETNYFFLNRARLASCREDQVLCLDADTVFFSDPAPLFDHQEDIVGIEDTYITGQPDWPGWNCSVPVLNGGVVLFNGCCREWANSLAGYCQNLMDGKYDVSDWVSKRNGYYRETFAVSLFGEDRGLRHGLFDRSEAAGLFGPQDVKLFSDRGTALFHYFNQNWGLVQRELFPPRTPRRLIRLR